MGQLTAQMSDLRRCGQPQNQEVYLLSWESSLNLMSHLVLLTVDALTWRRPRGYILIACGTQRGGANSDALAKFQFRDVGLLAILIGNVHHFPFSLLILVHTALVCFFAQVPSL